METYDRLQDAVADVEAEDVIVARAAGAAVGFIANAMANDAALDQQDMSDDIPADEQLFSVGWLCQRFQRGPAEIRSAMRQAKIPFVRSLNEVPYLDGYGLVALAKYFKAMRAKQGDKE